MKVYLQIAFHLPSFVAFRNKCPCPSERNFRATAFCNTSLALNYSCLFDENRGFNVESCITKTDFAPPGYKYLLRGQPDFTQCELERYQPIRLLSNVSNQCIFEKSKCIENGQFLFKNGTTETDRSCRCDYTRGYAFITKPKNLCSCIPSEEDCSCYKKSCPHRGLLTPDYDCATEKDRPGQNTYFCPIIVYKRLPTDSFIIKEKKILLKEQGMDFSSKLIAFVVTAICTFLIAVEGILVSIGLKGKGTVTSTASAKIGERHYEYRREPEFDEGYTLTTAEGNGDDKRLYHTIVETKKKEIIKIKGTAIDESEYSIQQYADASYYSFCGSKHSLNASTGSKESYTVPKEIMICSNGDQEKQCDDLSVVTLGRTENVENYEPVDYYECSDSRSKRWFIKEQ